MSGYIYLRDNDWFRQEGLYKMGIMSNGKDRDGGYITGEVKRGKFVLVIEIPLSKMKSFDLVLKKHFHSMNRRFGAGTEFYSRDIESLLFPFVKTHLNCRKLSPDEIDAMERKKRLQKYRIKLCKHSKPREHQQEVLDKIGDYYQKYDVVKLIWAPGLGKARLGLMIVEKMAFQKILIGVPSLHLQTQMVREIRSMFPNETISCVGGTSQKRTQARFTVTTYHSCDTIQGSFDFKIGDEAHHLVGKCTEQGFRAFHNIPSQKTLFMTATEKSMDSHYSMDDESVFGPYLDQKSVYWAIEHQKITDYSVVLLKNTAQEVASLVHSVNATNHELFLSCFMSLKSMEKYPDLTHILLYTNTMKDANLAKQYIDALVKVLPLSLYNNALHSENKTNLQDELAKFKASPRGIISCISMFGEGFDEPKLNGVCVSGNMQSEIRLVQYLLRPNRLEKGNPKKKAYILIPYLDEEWNTQKDKVSTIIRQLRNVDKNIHQKIRVCIPSKTVSNHSSEYACDLEEDAIETDLVKLRLRHSRTLGSDFTEEQDEYLYHKTMNRGKYQSRQEYLHDPDSLKEPDTYFKGKGVWTNWYDFLGVDTSGFINKEAWKLFCKGKVTSSDSYEILCKSHSHLPKEPSLFYPDFTNILNELGLFTRRR
jgi:predicted helicase